MSTENQKPDPTEDLFNKTPKILWPVLLTGMVAISTLHFIYYQAKKDFFR